MTYEIYVSYHLNEAGTATIPDEELLYYIPIIESERSVTDPVVKCEMGKTGSFEFSISPVHPFYNRFLQMKTIMRVVYDGDTIFRGRVLTIDTNKMNGTRRVHLEGDLAFLMDSQQEGAEESERPERTVYSYLKALIQVHNEQMDVEGSQYKQFTLGEVPGHYSSADSSQQITVPNSKFGSSSWRKTQDALSELTKEYGGYFRTRYNASTGVCYLDWLETYFNKTANTQPIKVTENMIDLNDTSEVDNIFTVLIPIGNDRNGKKLYIDNYLEQYHGDNKSITVPQMAAYMAAVGRSDELSRGFHKASDYANAIDDHGIIYKVQEFGDADTQQKLWNYAINWIRDCYNGKIVNFTATALDLHHLNSGSNQKYLVGDQVSIIFPDMSRHTQGSTPTETRTISLISVQYNLHNPEKNSYTIGIPNSLLSKSSHSRTSKKKTSMDARSSSNVQSNRAEDKQTLDALREAAEVFVISKEFNSGDYQALVESDPNKANAAVKATTVYVHDVYKATRGDQLWVRTTSATNQIYTDVGSIYKATNDSQWKLKTIYKMQVAIEPVEDGSVLPESGTLTWVSGGYIHTKISYSSYSRVKDPRQWIYYTSDSIGGARKGNIYKDSNNAQWEIVEVSPSTNKLLLMPLDIGSALPNSGTLIWVSGGSSSDHPNIPYDKTKTNIEAMVSSAVVMSIDGSNGTFIANKRIKDKDSYTDEELNAYNSFVMSVTIAAANEEIGLSVLPEYDSSGHMTNFLEFLDQFDISAGQRLYLRKMWREGKLDGLEMPETLSVNSNLGQVNLMESVFGKDGTGLLGTIFQNGPSSFVSFLDPTKAGSTSEDDKNVEIKGGGENGGEIGCGKKSDGSGGKRWTISLNKNLVWYEDNPQDPSHPIEHRVPAGTVGAEDYYLEKIPSFVTEFAYINTLLAEYIQTKNLVVENEAFITKLHTDKATSTAATIDHIAAQSVHAVNMDASNQITSAQFVLEIESGESSVTKTNLSNSFVGAMFRTSSSLPGKIILDFSKADGTSTGDNINFNIADTQFYKDAVSAAWNGGGATAHFVCSTSSETLEPGGSVDLYAYYMDDSSPAVPVRSYYSGTGRYSSRTISARSLRLRTPQAAVRPTTSNQTIVPGSDSGGVAYDGLAQVVVEGSTDLVQGNIKKGVSIFGVPGDYDPSPTAWNNGGATAYFTATRTSLDPGQSSSLYAYYTNYDGNQAMSSVSGQGKYSSLIITARNLSLQTETVYPSKSEQAAEPDPGYDGLSKVTVKPITISDTLTKENIKSGVRIVIGNSATDLVDITGEYQGGSSTPSKVEIWYADGSGKVPSRNISSAISIKPWCLIDNTWYNGDEITLTPTGGGGGGHNNPIEFTRASSPEDPGGHSYKYTATVGDNITGNAQKFTFYY